MRLLDAFRPRAESITWSVNGNTYPSGAYPVTTYGRQDAETLADDFKDYVTGGWAGNGIVSTVITARMQIFAEARFQFQRLRNGRPGDLFGTADLAILERPWAGGTTGDLLSRMLLDADLAGNAYVVRLGDELVRLRPDWTEIVLAPRMYGGTVADPEQVGYSRVGYAYWEGGKTTGDEAPDAVFTPDEVAHFAPRPDPLASYRGCSWLTPVVREIVGDGLATTHKVKFFENGATPNLVIRAPEAMSKEQFDKFVDGMDASHKGADNAYKTLYLGGGMDPVLVGANFQQMDFKVTQGAGETRIAAAGGIHPVVLGLSEGLAGSSLNAGNYQAAKRATADKTFRPLWRNVAGSLETLVPPPPPGDSRLWVDDRDIPFLRDDEQDRAQIQFLRAQTMRQWIDSGYTPDSVKAAMAAEDLTLLQHSGLYSVQLQAPGSAQSTPQVVP